ncbi:putative lipid phosphate phosphatase 1 [Saccharata proteae CBS 121410]|uniref:Lipid phosphate phosphatase 1 n=1 Tax=Saccharata proteae CBS 121410 TaxID=1314787 RepID=A0A9P4HY38_9PEZI|nr:putative lipid phosphate phosphatase 1 [Saccharata proteae CBS 121410]
MAIFSRRNAPADGNTAAAPNASSNNGFTRHDTHEDRPLANGSRQPGTPPLPSSQHHTDTPRLDILTMAAMGAIGLGVYEADPAPSRSFPVYFNDGQIVYPEFAYPLRNEIVPIWAAALLASLVPIAIFLLLQIRIRSFWDVNNATLGLLYSLITAAVFQVFLKWLIGGLRPHFYDVCKPAVPLSGTQTGNGLKGIMYDRSVCTGDASEINDSLESFPSGHSTAAFAGFIFLSLYLNAKLKLWSNFHPAFWKLIAVMAPLLAATLIAGALTIDKYHNWYDVVAGAAIGTLMAFSAYRMVYASVWDFRFNHVPLVRTMPFTYSGAGLQPFDGFHDALFTRKAGWGDQAALNAWGGAPFDAAALSGGAGMGSAISIRAYSSAL